MKKIRKGNEVKNIDCDDKFCRNCSYVPSCGEQKCGLFDVMLDHVVSGNINNSGWARHANCINAEEKTQSRD